MQGHQGWLNPLTGRVENNGPGNSGPITNQRELLRIGNSVTLERLSEMGREQTVIAPVTCTPQDSPNLVVSLNANQIEFDANAPPGTEFAAYIIAKITFGIGGARQELECDLKNGVQLSVMADALEVRARIEDFNNPGSPLRARVAASVSSGSRAARSFPTRTYPLTTVLPNTAANFAVPQYAYSLMLFGDPDIFVSGATDVFITGANASTGYSGGAVLGNFQGSQFFGAAITDGLKLPNGAQTVSIFNNIGTPVRVAPVFALSI